MSLYASNMTCYCVNLSYDEFINKINKNKDVYLDKLKNYAGNYLYFENPGDYQNNKYSGKIHHDLAVVNDRGEISRIGGNIYIDKDGNNTKGFFEYDSRTHEVKIDRTKIREINGDLTIGIKKSIAVTNNDVTIKANKVRILTELNENNTVNLFSNTKDSVTLGVSPNKIYLGDVCVKDIIDKEEELDKRTKSLITEINSWPSAVMNLYPVQSSLITTVTKFGKQNIDAKFIFSVTPVSGNEQITSEYELLDISSMYHLYYQILDGSNIFYLYVNASLNDKSEKYINFYISPAYYNYIYIDDKYVDSKEYMYEVNYTDENNNISKKPNVYFKYTVKCPGLDDGSATGIVLNTLYNECTSASADRDKIRLVHDILSEYNETHANDTYRGLDVKFKFRHVGYIKVCSTISDTIIPALYSNGNGLSSATVNFYTQTNNTGTPKISSSNLQAAAKSNCDFTQYSGITTLGESLFNFKENDYTNVSDDEFNQCKETKEALGRINRVFTTYCSVINSTSDVTDLTKNKYFYSSQHSLYNTSKSEGKIVMNNPSVTAWNYSQDDQKLLVYSKLKNDTKVKTWRTNILKKGIEKSIEIDGTIKIETLTKVPDKELLNLKTVPIDYTKLFRYRLDDSVEAGDSNNWSDWMCFNISPNIRINEDTKKLTIQVPSMGWTGNLGASSVFLLADLYKVLLNNKTIQSSKYGTENLTFEKTGDNKRIYEWVKTSFEDTHNALRIPKNNDDNKKNYSMIEALTINNIFYPGLLLSNALFMNIRNLLGTGISFDKDHIDEALTKFFRPQDTQSNYLIEFTIPLDEYPVTDTLTTLNINYVNMALHSGRYIVKTENLSPLNTVAEAVRP